MQKRTGNNQRRDRPEADGIRDAEGDRLVMKVSMTSAFLRSKKLKLINQRITDEERDFLMVRRKTANGGTTP
jgi:hypothetical protein